MVIYIQGIETISGITSGGEDSLDLADVLINHLEKTGLLCLVTCSRDGFKHIEHKPLGQKFTKLEILEPEKDQAIIMLESRVASLEKVYKVYFTYHAIQEIAVLTGKYLHETYLPAKAIDILEVLAVAVAKRGGKNNWVTVDDVASIVSEKTGIPLTKIGQSESDLLLHLEELIHRQMIGQEEAVSAVASALRRSRTSLTQVKRPTASFLFLGPTGVGKTELAKVIADVYFGDSKYMIRLDMSEYQTQDMLVKMIGDTNGNKGYLTEAVRQNPFSLVLLDEFEKAHPDILNLFLQVLDDGRLTDGEGRTIDFTNVILIATSNAGASLIQEAVKVGTSQDQLKNDLINNYLNKVMRPELINRFDGLIVFRPLTVDEVERVARIMLQQIGANLAEQGLSLDVSDEGLKVLAQAGYDPKFGGRHMRRVLQDRIENEIASKILTGELKRRDVVYINPAGQVESRKGANL